MSQQGDAVYFDGQSNRKRRIQIRLGSALEIVEDGQIVVAWPFGDLRRVDSAPGVFRLMCISAPALARLEIHDEAMRQAVESKCPALGTDSRGSSQTFRIIAYSTAALASFAVLLVYGVPLLADRLALIVPASVEKRLGEGVEKQVRYTLGGKVCEGTAGRAVLERLAGQLQGAAGLTGVLDVQVLATTLPNAYALPGGKVYVSDGLLQTANNADELAGIVAHEFGHLHHRDGLRKLIQAGGTAFMVGILFGDVLGGGAILFAARSLMTESYSRDSERRADAYAIDLMRKLGRSPRPMGELLARITGPQSAGKLTILSSHPLTGERLAAMEAADQPALGPELMSEMEWGKLQSICR